MKWNLTFLTVICLMFGLVSCENDFNLVAPGAEPLPVVYGIINVEDDAHYIRVEKIFIDQNIGPGELAQDPSNLYYDDLTVKIEREGSQNNTFTLDRVDGNEEGLQREPGYFADAPNYLYKFKPGAGNELEPSDKLTLKLSTSELDSVITATTEVLGVPASFAVPNPANNAGFNPEGAYTFRWTDEYDNSYAFDIDVTINYEEKVGDEPFVDKSFVWTVAEGYVPESTNKSRRFNGEGLAFFQAFVDNITPATNEIRKFKNFQIHVKAAGVEILEYIRIGQVNTGITSAQIIPTYSNLSEGRGLFSSRVGFSSTKYGLSPTTLDFVKNLDIMLPLNFQ